MSARKSKNLSANATSQAFYKASFALAAEMTWDRDLVEILNRLPQVGSAKTVMLEFEDAYHAKYGDWPDVVAVDVDSINERLQGALRIR